MAGTVRILVLGAGGMLGHKMLQRLSARFPDTWGTLHARHSGFPAGISTLFDPTRTVEGVDATDLDSVEAALRRVEPQVIVNCVGAIKQRTGAFDVTLARALNVALPQRLGGVAAATGARLIHFSTDCVFSGGKAGGRYTEADAPDPDDLYGRSKLEGEVTAPPALTLRLSFIGRELRHHVSLLDWFLAHRGGTVRGYSRAWWSGLTASHVADVVGDLVAYHPALAGVYHLAGERLTKHDLLCRLRDGLDLDVRIEPDGGPSLDRSLDGSCFAAATGYVFPGWEALIAALAADPTPYDLPAGGTTR
jgi:dTDP-4-dehydrorhamnose reductase